VSPAAYCALEHISHVGCDDEVSRLSRYMAMLTAYLDESRMEDTNAYPVIGGYLGTVEGWLSLTAAWRDVLRDEGVPQFHAADLWANDKPFDDRDRWTFDAKVALVDRLLDVIHESAICSVVTAIDNAAYLDVAGTRKQSANKYGSQYELCGYSAAALVGQYAVRESPYPIHFVFDERNRYRHYFERGYKLIQRGPFDFAPFLGPLTFASDERVVALQAADLIAWTMARSVDATLVKAEASDVPWAYRAWTELPRLEQFMQRPLLERIKGVDFWQPKPYAEKELNRFYRSVPPAHKQR
jgi:hypothetical protein